ncbi:MAG: ATP-dependent zinc metalloprotease FtsH, partial [Synergistaceae bacterium]|nr:ATP-dependent zinc metalloprotease FtsH [Synergistaceae bacterium]
MMDFARSKAKMFLDNRKKVTFADVAGCNEAKEELMEIVEFLKKPDRFANLGARVPKGVLLLGSPGTGKTLLARACAGEAEVPFFSISGSDFVEMFVGVGAARVRDMFDQAHKMHPCIIFIDEIDAVGRQRGTGLGGGHDEREQTLNQLLIEMDGFEDNSGIIVIAATNRADVLDPALLRSGRFDRQIVVDVPDVKGREAILRVHLQNKKIADGVDIATIAKRTPGFVGADLENITNEAALLAARHGKEKIEMPEFEEAIDKVIAGPERKSFVLTERDKKITACHEAGHAVVASKLEGATKVHKVSIIPRGRALGLTWQIPDTDKVHIAKNDLLNEITTLLGGRCAETLKFNDVTTGASNDLERATQAARDMVTRYGMSEKLGLVVLGRQQHEVFLGRDFADESKNYSAEIAYEIDKEVRNIIDSCFNKAKEILEANDAVLDELTSRLLEKEVLEGNELAELLGYPPEEEPETKSAETEETQETLSKESISENTEA